MAEYAQQWRTRDSVSEYREKQLTGVKLALLTPSLVDAIEALGRQPLAPDWKFQYHYERYNVLPEATRE